MPENNTHSGTSAVKVTILGGSSVGTPALIGALRAHSTRNQPIRLTLHGRTKDKLGPVARVAAELARDCEWLTVGATTDLAEALDGAQYVINQVRVGGLAARAFDETFPIQFGIPGEETVGPGGFANALRTIPQVIALAKQIERHAPDALLLSFANPASVVQYAVERSCKLQVIGLCDGAVTMTGWAAAALGVPAHELSVDYVGMHHFGFITRVVHDGQDMTAQALAGLEKASGMDMDLDVVRSLGAIPTPYWKYFAHPDRMLEKQRSQKQSRAEQLQALEAELVAEYAEGRAGGLGKRGAKWYDAIIAPVLMALIERRTESFVINVTNRGVVSWLPADAVIETPALFRAGQARAVALPAPNKEIMARVQLNCAYEQLMVEAILEQSETKALRALVMNPLVPNASVAREILKIVWPDADPGRSKGAC